MWAFSRRYAELAELQLVGAVGDAAPRRHRQLQEIRRTPLLRPNRNGEKPPTSNALNHSHEPLNYFRLTAVAFLISAAAVLASSSREHTSELQSPYVISYAVF